MDYFSGLLLLIIIYILVYQKLSGKHKKAFDIAIFGVVIVAFAYFFGEAAGEAFYYFKH